MLITLVLILQECKDELKQEINRMHIRALSVPLVILSLLLTALG